jgi:hypothetical protein
VGQDGILRPIVNRPTLWCSGSSKRPIANRPRDSIPPHLGSATFLDLWRSESLHWSGLTSGRYWIETPHGEVLRYTPEIRKLWNFPFVYVDYQVARLFEDVQEHLPAVLEPVPEDIATFASDPG